MPDSIWPGMQGLRDRDRDMPRGRRRMPVADCEPDAEDAAVSMPITCPGRSSPAGRRSRRAGRRRCGSIRPDNCSALAAPSSHAVMVWSSPVTCRRRRRGCRPAEGVAERDDGVADLERVRVAGRPSGGRRPRSCSSATSSAVVAETFALVAGPVADDLSTRDLGGAVDDVVVGEHQAGRWSAPCRCRRLRRPGSRAWFN